MTALPILRGPADPDQFRIKVGRFKERFYHDPLPGDDIADATDAAWPSATTVKGAWPKYLKQWAATEAAKCAVTETGNWRGMKENAAIEYIGTAHERTFRLAGDRGSDLHVAVVDLIEGRPVDAMLEARIAPWLPTLRQFVADCQPRILYSEVVTISRELGTGGTIDAGLEFPFDGKRRWVDWKSREAGKHDPYDDDAAQLGIYTMPDAYLIVEDNGRAKRIPLPQLDGAVIITIAPDGYRIHPVDLDVAHDLARSLRGFWQAMRTSPVGKPIVLACAGGTVAPAMNGTALVGAPDDGGLRAEHARQRLVKLADAKAAITWPQGVQSFKEVGLSKHIYTHDELAAIERALSDAEAAIQAEFPPAEPGCAPEAQARMVARLEALPPDLFEQIVVEAKRVPILNLRASTLTIRQLQHLEALVDQAETVAGQRAHSARGLLGEYGDDPSLGVLIVRLAGASDLSAVDDEQATRVAAICAALDDMVLAVHVAEDGTESIVTTAKAEELVVAFGDGTRPIAVRKAGDVAAAHGLKRHRSVGLVSADPLLCALVAQAARVPA